MKRVILLMTVALITILAAGCLNQIGVEVEAKEPVKHREIVMIQPEHTPRPTPAVDFDLTHLAIVCEVSEIGKNDEAELSDAAPAADDSAPGYDGQTIYDGEGQEDDQGDYTEQETEEEIQMTCLGDWLITFYCPCEACCGPWATGYTASGDPAEEWKTVATDQFEFGTELYVEGLGYFTVQDRGVEGAHLDIFVSDHQEALELGEQTRTVYLLEGEKE